jgi:CDP-2,3-bis-(O-geranylgeranyl)-sn-glycerol synthase
MIVTLFGFAFFLFLPAGIANMAPVLANKIPLLNRWKTPLDFGKSFRGQRILGDNKTWRGLATGTLLAGLVSSLEWYVFSQVFSTTALKYGLLLGFGALLGDAVESFFKRRVNVKPGHSWFPFDQVDYIIGGLLFTVPFYPLSIILVPFIIILFFGLHLIASYIGYLLNLKERPI